MENLVYKNYLKTLSDICSTLMEEQSSGYTGERNSKGEPHGYGIMLYDDSDREKNLNRKKYEGEWKNGMRDGKGTLLMINGGMYEGEFKDDKKHGKGKGKEIYDCGDIYEGEYYDGIRSGKGTYQWPSGQKYEGEWKNGLSDGKGKHTFDDGSFYEGDWKDDKRHGNGKEINKDGDIIYDGSWNNGEKDGVAKGILANDNGDNYDGDIKDSKKHGKGKMIYADGTKYEGEWKDDKRHGKGREYYEDGEIKYDCEWKNGKKDGEGIEYWSSGLQKFQGVFKNDIYSNGKYKDDYNVREGDLDQEGWLINGTSIFKDDKMDHFDTTYNYHAEVRDSKFIRGTLQDDNGTFEGELTGGSIADWPYPYTGYSNGHSKVFGEYRYGKLEGNVEINYSEYGAPWTFDSKGAIRKIKGQFSNGHPDGDCRVTFYNGRTYNGKGNGEGSLTIFED